MAKENKPKKRRIRQAPQTVREKAQKSSSAKPKKRPVKGSISFVGSLVRKVFRFLGRILKPFSFLLWPFKTKPLRFVGRILYKVFLINYFKSSWRELKQVTWPNRKQTWQLTLAVFIFAFAFGIAVATVDYGLDKVFRKVLLQ